MGIQYRWAGKREEWCERPVVSGLSFIIVLADNYSGGGTYFPRWNLTITGQEPGSMVMYPSGLSHLHAGKKITSGERYVLLGATTGED